MAPASPHMCNNQSDDELDDILSGIVEGREIPGINNPQTQSDLTSRGKGAGTGGDGLGIDEEIIVTKKRIPIPKLDDERLLSDAGIPRLRKISKERLRFKGKGHEYGDIARMLNMYQLWLDDLYPRAKFADALAMVEKAGHTKRMQIMRKDWIDEGKPRRATEREDEDVEDVDDIIPDAPSAEQSSVEQPSVELPALEQAQAQDQTGSGVDPDEDELDALLAETAQQETLATKTLPVRTTAAEDDPFADEMEAMADMDDMWK